MLRMFHVVFITASTLVAIGTCIWAFSNDQPLFGVLSLVTGGLLLYYQNRFLRKAREIGL